MVPLVTLSDVTDIMARVNENTMVPSDGYFGLPKTFAMVFFGTEYCEYMQFKLSYKQFLYGHNCNHSYFAQPLF